MLGEELQRALHAEGLHFTVVKDAASALQYALEAPPDLIFLAWRIAERKLPGSGDTSKDSGKAPEPELIDGSGKGLTPTELNLLRYFMANPGKLLNRDVLLRQVLKYRADSRTLDTHIARLRKKMGDAGTAIKGIRGAGYIYEPA